MEFDKWTTENLLDLIKRTQITLYKATQDSILSEDEYLKEEKTIELAESEILSRVKS